jgi:hypothetical protein
MTKKNHKNINQDSQWSDQDSNRVLPKNKAAMQKHVMIKVQY